MSWYSYDVIDGWQYRLHLCQTHNGVRFFKLVQANSDADKIRSGDVILATEIISNDLLRKKDIQSITKTVALEDGENFFVDAHNVWLTRAEVRQLHSGVKINSIQWATSIPPNFSPM